ncbi:MAG: S1 RNA-binding domain-containing protein, partial [Bacteroidota bacterium]
ILGDEDHLGDMDFKVTGTKDGITACQMDIKVEGLDYGVLEQALEQARNGRLHILNEMLKTISEPNTDFKPHVPRIVKLAIPKDMVGAIIGPGGKMIQEIQSETGTTIAIDSGDDFASAQIFSEDQAGIEAAVAKIKGITAMPEVGEVYKGVIKSIVSFGAFVEILPGKEGLLHISEIDWRHIKSVEDELSVGQEVDVKLLNIEKGSGNLKLSRKVLLPKPEKKDDKQN